MDAWEILEIEPTGDARAIRRAYARQAKKYHPEDDPEGFQRLRAAYEQALRSADFGRAAEPAGCKRPPAFDFDRLLARGMAEHRAELHRRSMEVIGELRRLPRGLLYAGLGKWQASLSREDFLQVQYFPAFMEALAQLLEGPPRYPECIRNMILRRYRFPENRRGPAAHLHSVLTADGGWRKTILSCFVYALYLAMIGWCAKRHFVWAFFLVFFIPIAAYMIWKKFLQTKTDGTQRPRRQHWKGIGNERKSR